MSAPMNEFKSQTFKPLTKDASLTLLNELRSDIIERQNALIDIQHTLQIEAKQASSFAKYSRIAVIVLGTFAATREAADRIFPHTAGSTSSNLIVVTYTIMALAITVLGSIATALRFTEKASELNILAAECNACLLRVDCQMPREGEALNTNGQVKVARKLISYQNEKISEIQAKAAKTGVIVQGIKVDSAQPLTSNVAR